MPEINIPGEWQDVPVAKVRPNPHRDLERYSLQDSRVKELRKSVHQHGQLDRVYGRAAKGGAIEIAFGHHLLGAIKAEGLPVLRVKVCQIDDAEMLRLMASENGESYNMQASHAQLVVEKARDFIEGRIFPAHTTLDAVLTDVGAMRFFEGLRPEAQPSENVDRSLLIDVFATDGKWETAAQNYLDQRNGRVAAAGFMVGVSQRAVHRFIGAGSGISEKATRTVLENLEASPWAQAARDVYAEAMKAAQERKATITINQAPVATLIVKIKEAGTFGLDLFNKLDNDDRALKGEADAVLAEAVAKLKALTDDDYLNPVALPDLSKAFEALDALRAKATAKLTEEQRVEAERKALEKKVADWRKAAGGLSARATAAAAAHTKAVEWERNAAPDHDLVWLSDARKTFADLLPEASIAEALALIGKVGTAAKAYADAEATPQEAFAVEDGFEAAITVLEDYRAGMKLVVSKQKDADKLAAEINVSLVTRFGSSSGYWAAFQDVARELKLSHAEQAEAVDDLLASLSSPNAKTVWDGPKPPLSYCGVRKLPIATVREDIIAERVRDRRRLLLGAPLRALPISEEAYWLLPHSTWRRDYLALSQTVDFRKLTGEAPEAQAAWILQRMTEYGPDGAVVLKGKDGGLTYDTKAVLTPGWFLATVKQAVEEMKNPLVAMSPEVRALILAMKRTQAGLDAAAAGFRQGSKILSENPDLVMPGKVAEAFEQRIAVVTKLMNIFAAKLGKMPTFDDGGGAVLLLTAAE